MLAYKIWSVDELAETAAYEDGNLVGKGACRAGLSAPWTESRARGQCICNRLRIIDRLTVCALLGRVEQVVVVVVVVSINPTHPRRIPILAPDARLHDEEPIGGHTSP